MAFKSSFKWLALATLVLIGALAVLVLVIRDRGRADMADGQVRAPLQVSTASFPDGGLIPSRFTCQGSNLSPNIEFSTGPAGTKSFAVVMEDEDALFGFVHWIVYDIPIDEHSIGEGASAQRGLSPESREGINDRGAQGYTGPCPPGKASHRYLIRVYALNITPNLPAGMTKRQLSAVIRNRVLAEGQIAAIYQNGSGK